MDTSVGRRILALDLLRGFFLAVIAIDHLYRFPNVFEFFTGRGQQWVSAAEGFFIISGVLIGYLYGGRVLLGMRGVLKKVWSRSFKLYLCSIGLTLLFTFWGQLMPQGIIKSGIWSGGGLGSLFLQILTLRYVYGWSDFLAYYVVFLLFAPLALWLTKRVGWWSTVLVSLAIWSVRGNSFYLAWQSLFMVGTVVGCYLPELETKFSSMERAARRKFWTVVGGATVGTLGLSILFFYGVNDLEQMSPVFNVLGNIGNAVGPWFDKDTLGPGRLMLALLWFTALYGLVRTNEQRINTLTRGWLNTLGQNSLFVYGLQAVVLFPVNLVMPVTRSFVVNTLTCSVVLVMIYLITARKEMIKGWLATTFGGSLERRYYWLEVPRVVLAVLVGAILGGR